ncbi:MAG TPA: hypothetical protein VK212_10400 [Lentimicrobium sp.]|nr:hypothetical protein [Lentimicrobium sp.]
MSQLLELILIIVALYLFFRLFVLYLAPWLLKIYFKRLQNRFFGQNQATNPKEKEGKVTIHRMKDKKNNDIPKDLGEYIDYEELNNHKKPTDE